MTLAETQALLHEAITSGAPLAAGRLERCVAATPALSPGESVEIYAGMYLARLVEALRETFPDLARCLGDEAFAGLAEDYVRRRPSEHHDVGRCGSRLTAFLREHPDPERPWLADLAELEWARQEAFFAPAARAIDAADLAALGADALERAGLVLHPALRVLALEHDVAPLWRQLERGARPDPPAARPSRVAVWRQGFDVFHCPLAAEEAEALDLAARGARLPEICAPFAAREEPLAAAQGAVGSWIAEGWIVEVRAPARLSCAGTAGAAERP